VEVVVLLIPAVLGVLFLAVLPWAVCRPERRTKHEHADDWTSEHGIF
jgi:hypothetical protein